MARGKAGAMRRPGLAWRCPVLWLWGFTVLICSWVYSQETTALHQQSLRRSRPPSPAPVLDSSARGLPWVNLTDAVELPWRDPEGIELSENAQQSLEALSLATADFDEDGVRDLVSGFGSEDAGTVRLNRGNADYLFPYSESARRHKLEGLLQDTPFLANTLIFSLPEPPTFLGAGDFDGDGHKDLVAAERGGHQLWFLAGSGDGFFDSPAPIRLEGMVSGLAVGEVGRADGLEDIVVCVDGEGGPQLQIFQHDLGALDGETRSILLPEVAAVVRIGRLDPRSAPHIAVISGGRLGLLSTEAERIQRASDEGYVAFDWYTFDTPALSLALGDFAGESETELAVLCSGGVVEVLRQIEGGMEVAGARSLLPSQSWDGARLMRTRTSTHRKDDLLIVDAARGSLHLLVGDKVDTRVLDASGGSVMVRLAAAQTITAALPLRANRDAQDDLVFVESGSIAPMVVTTQGGGFTVDSAADDPDVNKGDDQCVTAAGKCTLRAAIEEPNAKPDKNVISFAPGITSIQPAGLPATMHPVDIEGGETRVEIDGGFGFILRIDGGGSTLSRLIVNGGSVRHGHPAAQWKREHCPGLLGGDRSRTEDQG